ncbi:hypothetical protein TBR22_A47230 [Luteitalea sp. TBR-22]|uniref:putative sensor domain DACNV-containing protein n=1 Tax=Luteitalea sp. TBR-22 TaxID=2802971 RepID=UPI001AFAA2DF|nr:diadenylate cyclase [Luteitalea sp. TBR-22]BCS35492.1 hypothetical protein TBR22_A47230 [Luteitalea sp. TBR-22]
MTNAELDATRRGIALEASRRRSVPTADTRAPDMTTVRAAREAPGNPTHAYPRDLARLVRVAWRQRRASGQAPPVPHLAALESLLSVCYQASLLREEGRGVTFRLVVGSAAQFPENAGPPDGLHRLVFARRRWLDAQELRRLAPAADAARALIGVRLSSKGVQVWGLLHAGVQWLADADQVGSLLLVSVASPGHLVVTLGGTTLAELGHGRLGTSEVDALESPVLLASFGGLAGALAAASPASASHDAGEFASGLAGHVLRRAVAIMREGRHGGTLVVIPAHRMAALTVDGSLRTKYRFAEDHGGRRALTIAAGIMRDIAARAGEPPCPAWRTFLAGRAGAFRDQDLALLELSQLVSGLSQVDGAVVLTDALDIVGFGAEIGGHLQSVQRVAHALDLAGTSRQWVRADRVGTRHRAAYRLCQAVHEALVLVVSQDGGLRLVRWQDEAVTYWAQVARRHWES